MVTSPATESYATHAPTDPEQGSGWSRLAAGMVVLAFLFGLMLRFWIFTGPLGEINSDEALVGLMALQLLGGEWNTFFWGQAYGGVIDVILLAPVVAVLGATQTALQVVPFLQSVAATFLVWAIGRRIIGRRGGLVAAALFWVFPPAFVWWQTRQSLLYLPILLLGLVLVWSALRIEGREGGGLGNWVVFGLAAGIGWWTSPQILYFLVPTAIWLVVRGVRPRAREVAVVLGGFLIGALPWLVINVAEGWPSLQIPPVADGPSSRLNALARGGLPMAFGLKVPFTERWLWPGIGRLLYLVGIVLLGMAVIRRRREDSIHLWLLLAFPVLFTLIPAAAYVGSGRYFFFLAPPLVLAFASLPTANLARAALLGVAMVLSTVGLYQMRDLQLAFVPDTEPLVEALDERDIRHAVGGFWLSYKLTWETGERIIATPLSIIRYPAYAEAVRDAGRVAYVYNLYEPPQRESAEAFRRTMQAWGFEFEDVTIGGFAVLIPDDRVVPDQLPAEAIPTP